MKLLADLHTHSKNSRFGHGKNSIEEMAIAANEIGLVEIGITDHGYSHFFKTSKQKLKQARKIVDEINSWSKTKVLLGIEADIIKEDGTIDIDNETLSMLDILIVGYHRLIFTDFAGLFGNTKKTEQAFTTLCSGQQDRTIPRSVTADLCLQTTFPTCRAQTR